MTKEDHDRIYRWDRLQFLLRGVEGPSEARMAERCGLNKSALSMRYTRAVEKFRKRWTQMTPTTKP